MFDKYTPLTGYDISLSFLSTNLTSSIQVSNKYDCFSKCSTIPSCLLVYIKLTQCNLYTKIDFTTFTNSPGSLVLYEKNIADYSSINSYLTNHWSFNGNPNDKAGNDNLSGGLSYSYTTDRLNKPSSALYLNGGYITAPSDCYFCTDFTVSVWLKVNSYRGNLPSQRLFDFASANAQDLVMCDLYGGINFGVANANYFIVISAPILPTGKWQHLSLTLQGSYGTIYVNGIIVKQGNLVSVRSVIKTQNYVGSSYNIGANRPDAIYDDFKIFNRSLTQSEIKKVMNSYF